MQKPEWHCYFKWQIAQNVWTSTSKGRTNTVIILLKPVAYWLFYRVLNNKHAALKKEEILRHKYFILWWQKVRVCISCGAVGSVEKGEYPRTLEYWGGPSSTCDDIRHQGLINALYQGDGCRLGQGVVRIGPGRGGRCPSLLTHRHLVHGVQRARRQKFTWEDNEVYT